MRLMLIILAVMAWTVESKTTVKPTDDSTTPSGLQVDYRNTYNKGQVRAGDTATLHVSHMGGIRIDAIAVYVKSNKNAGAGTFTLTVDGNTIAEKSGTFEDWTGGYDNTEAHTIGLLPKSQSGVQDVVVTLVGTTNSLHIEQYAILWSAGPAHTVTLMNGSRVYETLTESSGSAGVVLPNVADTASWEFIGWSETEIWSSYEIPELHAAQSTFYPSEDCTLWATYTVKTTPEQVYATGPESGYYMYLNTLADVAIAGAPADGAIQILPVNTNDLTQWYEVAFNTTGDSATIRNTATGEYVGFAQDKLQAVRSVWNVYQNEEQTVFYMTYNGKKYVLFPAEMAETDAYTGLYKTENIASAPTALMTQIALPCCEEITCHPEAQGVEEVEEFKGSRVQEVLMHFGNYDLIVKDGKKELRRK